MNWDCQYTRSRLQHYIQRELSVTDRRIVGRHLDECSQCQTVYHRQRQFARELQAELPRFGMPHPYQLSGVWSNVQAQLALGALPTGTMMPSRWWYSVAVAALMMFLVLPMFSARTNMRASLPLPPSPIALNGTATPTAPTRIALFIHTESVRQDVLSAKLYNTPVPLTSQP